jgi:hypothetical protein
VVEEEEANKLALEPFSEALAVLQNERRPSSYQASIKKMYLSDSLSGATSIKAGFN